MQTTTVAMAGLLALTGCARGPNISTDALPLTRVVVYRNGVGYFERAGRVDADEVRFRMRQRMVGDFLATLAIVERGGSSVRAASFPLDIDEKDAEPPPEPVESLLKPWPRPEPEKDPAEKMREVVLSMDGAKHDLAIGYVAGRGCRSSSVGNRAEPIRRGLDAGQVGARGGSATGLRVHAGRPSDSAATHRNGLWRGHCRRSHRGDDLGAK
jgi:hypothetical protein